ncbi:serine/threonine-protein kinase [Lysinibacillus sp. NPDC097214]|uniref:serine/threonine-protein kinase n=1 Tax=Lysinibacillus sp. NPDC097214 TaxID=3390584 RepID=UPI003D02F977
MIDNLIYENVKGQGSFALVSRYRDIHGNKFAVKKIKKEVMTNEGDVNRFRREIDILTVLNGEPHIVPLLESNEKELWYVMPYAEKNLYEYISQNNQFLSEADRVEIFEKILDGISIAHSKSILHRDISPNNILKIGDEWYICDFGLGKDYSKYTKGGYSSVTGYGSILYAAPEQIDKLKDASVQSDIYSLGKIFYFILTGKEPRDINDAPSYKSVIKGAASERVEDRYENVSKLKKEVAKYKNLYSVMSTTNLQDMTVRDYLAQTQRVNWNELYEVAMKFNVTDHVYYDFVDPITTILSDTKTIESFYTTINNNMYDFIVLFRQALEKCYTSTGWPFSSMNSFGYFLNRLYRVVSTDSRCQMECLKELWDIAAYHDQWAVQDTIIGILQENSILQENEREFALYMLEMDKTFAKLGNATTGRISSSEIVRVITHLKAK